MLARPDLFSRCHIIVLLKVSPLHTKGREDKSKSAYVTPPIHHGAEGHRVSCDHISPQIQDELSLLVSVEMQNAELHINVQF